MSYDHTELLNLLAGYKSEETRRAHRNVSITAFVIFVAWLLGLKITKVEAFGLKIGDNSELMVLGIATVLLTYWLASFWVSWLQDREIQKERSIVLEDKMEPILTRHEQIEAKMTSKPGGIPPSDRSDINQIVSAYREQKLRTRRAQQLQSYSSLVEIVVPNLLAASAYIALGNWFTKALC